MSDAKATFQLTKNQVKRFVAERDWTKFHSPKNLSMALAGEAAELMELYQWLTESQSKAFHEKKENKKMVEEEVADIATFLFEFCNVTGIDLSEAIKRKAKINEKRYPKKLVKGKAHKYTYYQKKTK